MTEIDCEPTVSKKQIEDVLLHDLFFSLLFHFNDLSLDIRKQVHVFDAKSGCLQNANKTPSDLQSPRNFYINYW